MTPGRRKGRSTLAPVALDGPSAIISFVSAERNGAELYKRGITPESRIKRLADIALKGEPKDSLAALRQLRDIINDTIEFSGLAPNVKFTRPAGEGTQEINRRQLADSALRDILHSATGGGVNSPGARIIRPESTPTLPAIAAGAPAVPRPVAGVPEPAVVADPVQNGRGVPGHDERAGP